MEIIETHIVPDDIERVRLSDYGKGIFKLLPSRKGFKKAILRNDILVNGTVETTAYWVQPGDEIALKNTSSRSIKVLQKVVPVVFEDEHLAIINKPGGLQVSGNAFQTLVNALPFNLKESKEADKLPIYYPVHRIDAPTCGLVLIAKTKRAQLKMSQMFADKQITKTYKLVVVGSFPDDIHAINDPIEGKPAETIVENVKVLPSKRFGHLSVLEVKPLTGRTHQIRKHLSNLGYPILGDKLYGEPGKILFAKGLFLCASGLKFIHPIFEVAVDIAINPPNKFDYYVNREAKRASLA